MKSGKVAQHDTLIWYGAWVHPFKSATLINRKRQLWKEAHLTYCFFFFCWPLQHWWRGLCSNWRGGSFLYWRWFGFFLCQVKWHYLCCASCKLNAWCLVFFLNHMMVTSLLIPCHLREGTVDSNLWL